MFQNLQKDTEIGLITASNVAHEKLAEARLDLKRPQVEAEVYQLRVESVGTEIELSMARIQELEGLLEAHAQSKEG